MKTKFKEGRYYSYFISDVCMVYCKVIRVDVKKGYFIASFRPTRDGCTIPFWQTHAFHDKCVTTVVPISKALYENTLRITRVIVSR